jgi:hypothetical protein
VPGRSRFGLTTGGPRNVHQDEVCRVAIHRARFFAASGERQKPSSSRQRSREGVVHVSKLWHQHPRLSSILPALQLLGHLSIAAPSGRTIPTALYYPRNPKVTHSVALTGVLCEWLFIIAKVRRPSRFGEFVARTCSRSSWKNKLHSSMETARAALSRERIAFKGNSALAQSLFAVELCNSDGVTFR